MSPFASPTGEPRPDMVLLLGVMGIALCLARTRIGAAAAWVGAVAAAVARRVGEWRGRRGPSP